jgi:signal transduction histidine kinase
MRPRKAGNWRAWLIGGYVIIVVLLAALWGWSLFSPIDEAEKDQQFENLTALAHVDSVALKNMECDAKSAVAELATGDDMRVTLIGMDGIVLADSITESSSMENHSERPEVQAALVGQIGYDQRHSSTEGVDYLYVAMPASFGGNAVVLRVSMPLSEVHTLAKDFRNTGLVLLAAAVLLSLLIAWRVFSKASEPVNQLETVRTDFVANASHELKTPVAGIKLLSESISQAHRDGDGEAVKLFSDRLGKESARLEHLVYSLLDLSRLEDEHRKGLTDETCDMRSAVATSFEGYVSKAGEKGLFYELHDDMPADAECRVNLSPADASLIVDNLIENAISYTESGGVTVALRMKGREALLSVADTGIGIAQGEQERIFERFYRIDKARSRDMGGTGLGLSLVRHAVDRGWGTIRIESGLGEGTTFTVLLPLAGD